MRKLFLIIFVILLAMCSCANAKTHKVHKQHPVVLGVERITEPQVQQLLADKRLGVFTNQSGVDSRLERSVDLLRETYNVTGIFVPEHGLFGAVPAGDKFADSEYDGIPVHSLYGDSRRPSKEMLDTIDVMVVDIQDVGIRHYTYFSSLSYIMEECAKYDKQVVVLDRPNPLGGAVQGPVLKPGNETFIGLYQIPLRHGLTIGEFARYINEEENIHCKLEVVPMLHYHRNMMWRNTQLPWVLSSPQIPTMETALVYGATGVSGSGNLSVGVGTAQPFQVIGAPFADATAVKAALDALQLPGVRFRAAAFTPRYGKFEGELVQGVQVYLTDVQQVNLPELDYRLFTVFRSLYPEQVSLSERDGAEGYKMDIELGESSLREGADPEETFARWQEECDAFVAKAKPYFLYK